MGIEDASRLVRGIRCGDQLADRPLQLHAIQHHVSPASETDDAYLAADPHHAESALSAGMGLFQFQYVSDLHSDDLHSATSKNNDTILLYHKSREM